MNDHTSQSGSSIGRRLFLGAATSVLLAPAVRAEPVPRKVRSLLAEGVVTPETVLSRQPITLPPDLIAALQAGAQIRIRVEYPRSRDLLMFYAFLAGPLDPPPPLAELREDDPRLFARLAVEVHETLASMFPEPSFGLFGRIVGEPKPSPFFPNLTGRVSDITASFQHEGETTFTMLGVSGAGDHVVYAREARGKVELQP